MNRDILSKIEQEQMISREELEELLTTTDQELIEELYRRARATAGKYYGKEIYLRGLIEFTNYCKNNCYYCGIRCGNEKAQRYRLTMDQILSCCESGWELGFRTFVLQGGEDPYYTDERICTIIKEIKKQSHADRHGDDEDHIRHGLYLIGEHLQVRLGNGDEKAQQKAERQHDADPARLGDARAHALAHRRHGQLRAEGEEHHAHHQQHRAEEERHQHARRERGDGEAQDQHDGEDGQHRGKRFL